DDSQHPGDRHRAEKNGEHRDMGQRLDASEVQLPEYRRAHLRLAQQRAAHDCVRERFAIAEGKLQGVHAAKRAPIRCISGGLNATGCNSRESTTEIPAQIHGFPSISTQAMRAVFCERLAQAWLVPRWMSTSPARISVSPSSITAQISPSSRIA